MKKMLILLAFLPVPAGAGLTPLSPLSVLKVRFPRSPMQLASPTAPDSEPKRKLVICDGRQPPLTPACIVIAACMHVRSPQKPCKMKMKGRTPGLARLEICIHEQDA